MGLSNNLEWAPSSICELYKARWAIEVFFKQLKQTLQLADFLGYSKQAVRWQVWTALLTYLLLRFIAFKSMWKWSFPRLFTAIRGVLWSLFNLFQLLTRYGTAHGYLSKNSNSFFAVLSNIELEFLGFTLIFESYGIAVKKFQYSGLVLQVCHSILI